MVKNLVKKKTVATPKLAVARQAVTLDLRWVAGALAVIILIMLCAWKPWHHEPAVVNDAGRTIKVNGQATIKAAPDEFVFYPTYTVTNPDRSAALSEIARRSGIIGTALRDLGVPESQIKSNANGYDQEIYPSIAPAPPVPDKPGGNTSTYSLQLTITVTDRALVQKVQDYLVTTQPTGSVTPTTNFSTARRKQLEGKARDDATKDARSKANQTARSLGFHLGDVKAVTDGTGFGGVAVPLESRMMATDATTAAAPPKLDVQPGENELNYSVTVEYYVR